MNKETLIWITADCTGHGVPGALMSIIGNVLLNRIIIEKGISKVDLVLSQLRQGIIDTIGLKVNEYQHKEGMDMAICRLDMRTKTLYFAGGNTRLWIVNDGEIREYKGDNQPVGYYYNVTNPFSEVVVPLEKGDVIYTFTDGFPDQFGGSLGKKYGYKRFRKFLVELSTMPMDQQLINLEKEFNGWKGSQEQLDDITVIGIQPL